MGRKARWKRKVENVITPLRIRHSGLNYNLYKINKYPTGKSTNCTRLETVEHVLPHGNAYSTQRNYLFQSLEELKTSGLHINMTTGR